MPLISLELLDADTRNANVCSAETLEKIKRNIERTRCYPPLIIRPHPEASNRYILIDGHHRKRVLEQLGYSEAECQVWDISDHEAQIALATLNTLRGTDNLRMRAELFQSLTRSVPIPDLALIVPETPQEIEDLLETLRLDFQEMEARMKQQIEAERATLPIPFTCMITAEDFPIVEAALTATGVADRGQALVTLCQEVQKHENH